MRPLTGSKSRSPDKRTQKKEVVEQECECEEDILEEEEVKHAQNQRDEESRMFR